MFNKIKVFIQESRQELKRVNWPTREDTIRYTIFVVGLSVAFALLLGILDFIFIEIIKKLILS